MNIPYSATPRYTTEIHDDDVFVIEEHASGFEGMKRITVADFLQPVYDKIYESTSNVYKFMGSVDVYENLPTYQEPQVLMLLVLMLIMTGYIMQDLRVRLYQKKT